MMPILDVDRCLDEGKHHKSNMSIMHRKAKNTAKDVQERVTDTVHKVKNVLQCFLKR